jgi:hypothetical protein
MNYKNLNLFDFKKKNKLNKIDIVFKQILQSEVQKLQNVLITKKNYLITFKNLRVPTS